ncbi:hypothetical protein ABZ619_03940 [Streptomyces sp. NPDC007851]|uniref:hypothetical protein n=1 Tax=Streptomyces sp. NPDC007851 TaxID=3155008 RepID=UPI00340CC05A
MGLGVGPPGMQRGSLARACPAVALGAGLPPSAACGAAGPGGRGGSGGSGGHRHGVGVLLPGGGASRFGRFDRPLVERKPKQLCPGGPAPVVAATPDADVQQQFGALITRGVDVLVLAAIAPGAPRRPVEPCGAEADAAVRMAVAQGRGEPVTSVATGTVAGATTKRIPSGLPSYPVTAGTIKDTPVTDWVHTLDQNCTPGLRSACAKTGLSR